MSSVTLHKGENSTFLTNLPITDKVVKKGKQTIIFENPPHIVGRMTVVGEKEGKGPVGKYFPRVLSDDTMGEKQRKPPRYFIDNHCLTMGHA